MILEYDCICIYIYFDKNKNKDMICPLCNSNNKPNKETDELD